MYTQGSLTEGEGSVQLTSLFISAAFHTEAKFFRFHKPPTVLSLSLQ